MKKLTHPLGKTIPHNTKGTPLPSGADPKASMEQLRTSTKLARYGAQAATSDVGGPAFTKPI